jgi:Predicted periplasmic solute-binding protein
MGATTRTKVILNIAKYLLQLFLNIIFYVLVIMATIELSKSVYVFSYQIFGNVAVQEKPGQDITVHIKKGESTMSISRKLETQKIIVNKYSFFIRAKLTLSSEKPILPGTYTLNTSMNYDKILETITGQKKEEKESTE